MKKFKLTTRYIVPILSYLFLTGLFFSAGYLIGQKNTNEIMTVSPAVKPTQQLPEAPQGSPQPVFQHYRVILEDGQLRIYLDDENKSRLISNDIISESLYPSADISKLKNGVIFNTIDEALSYAENFLS